MTQNRKRGRNLHEDETEFMPLSKRINNLHINNGMLLENGQSIQTAEWGPGPPYLPSNTHVLPESPPESVQSLDWSNATNAYNPDLSESQNPFYFNINKLLYEMYLARQQRNSN